jgi:hypothetical protein
MSASLLGKVRLCSERLTHGKVPIHFGCSAWISSGESDVLLSSASVGGSTSNTFSSAHFFWIRFSMSMR